MSEDVDTHICERYEIHKRLGKGAYGIVWKATDRRSGDTIALKKIFDAFRNSTDAQRTFREIMFLQEFGRHPNIIKLYNINRAENDKDIYLVFEYMEADLHNVIKKATILKDIHKQYIMCQLFRAVRYLHSGNVLHRDLKPSNVLLDADCRVKLADFGLARSFSQLEEYPDGQNMPELTEYVATRWYRSPEILLGAKRYTKGVDMWSLGCILGEMLLGRALFPGSSTINQIERIMNTVNHPSKNDIESIGSHYANSVLEKMPQKPRKPLEMLLANSPVQAVDMVNRLLIFAPLKRLTVEQCLVHPYVLQFHNPMEEPALNYDVTLSLPDHIQLTVDEYRDKLYDMITAKKTHIRRIQHDRPVSMNHVDESPPPRQPPPPPPTSQPQFMPNSYHSSMVSLPSSSAYAAHHAHHNGHPNGRVHSSATLNGESRAVTSWAKRPPAEGQQTLQQKRRSMSRAVSVTESMTNGPMASGGSGSAGSGGSGGTHEGHYESDPKRAPSHQQRQKQWRTFTAAAANVAANGKQQTNWEQKQQQKHVQGPMGAGNNIEKDDNHRKNGHANGLAHRLGNTFKSSPSVQQNLSHYHLQQQLQRVSQNPAGTQTKSKANGVAPIAQAECSDTDFETTSRRSPHDHSTPHQNNHKRNGVAGGHNAHYNQQQREKERAQSADNDGRNRKNGTPVNTSPSTLRQSPQQAKSKPETQARRRSNDRFGGFLASMLRGNPNKSTSTEKLNNANQQIRDIGRGQMPQPAHKSLPKHHTMHSISAQAAKSN
ncbi:protein kinase domain-containing protein [Ditylenchus destructor]|nr:protein kinase domain-containing protein [Ditylenchus destructor]